MFKDVFVELLQKNKVSAYKLSKETGIPQSVISYWKSGAKMPSSDNLAKLSQYFGVSTDYLLGRTDNPQKTTSAIDEYLARIEAKEPNQAIIMHRNEKGGQEVIQLSEERLQRILKIIDLMDNEDKKQ